MQKKGSNLLSFLSPHLRFTSILGAVLLRYGASQRKWWWFEDSVSSVSMAHSHPANANTKISANAAQGLKGSAVFHDFFGKGCAPPDSSPAASASLGASSAGGRTPISTTSDLASGYYSLPFVLIILCFVCFFCWSKVFIWIFFFGCSMQDFSPPPFSL